MDPAVYARALMQLARGSCVALSEDRHQHLRRPGQVLHEAWHQISASTVVGSSTACLVSLHPSKAELLAANVGDSGFLLLRNAGGSNAAADERRGFQGTLDAYGAQARSGSSSGHHVAFRSPQQLRAFNAPFQLGRAGDVAPGTPDDRFETPHDAALVRVPIKDGDVVVLATDGTLRTRTHRAAPSRTEHARARARAPAPHPRRTRAAPAPHPRAAPPLRLCPRRPFSAECVRRAF